MPRPHPRSARLLFPVALATAISAAATPSAGCAAVPPLEAWCSCGGVASIGRAMDSAALVVIAVLDTTAPDAARSDASTWPLLIERAWKWPGGGAAPPRHVVVAQRSPANACAIRISPGERQLVVASVRPADGVLVLGHKCATPWGAVDTLGPTASANRQFAVRAIARMLDSLRAYGPGIEPPR